MMIPELFPTTQTPVEAAKAALLALEVLYEVERTGAVPTPDQRALLAAYPGMGRLALDIFPHPQTKAYKSPRWTQLGTQLSRLATPDDYASMKRSVFTAFYTSPLIMRTLWQALERFGVPHDAHVFEPGCGVMRFASYAPEGTRMTGVELDSVSARIAQALYPQHTIRQGNLASVPLPPHTFDAVIGNVPFADLHYTYWGLRLSLHELCLARSLDVLKPGGVLSVVITHYFLDRQASDFRLALDAKAEFLGAIRLPDDAFQAQGTRVVTDLVFFLKRDAEQTALEPPQWTQSTPLLIEGVEVAFNAWVGAGAGWVLGHPTRKDRLYGRADTYTIAHDADSDLATRLAEQVQQLAPHVWHAHTTPVIVAPAEGVQIPRHCTEGSFFIDGVQIYQVQHGCAVVATHGRTVLTTIGRKTGRRLAHLIELRDLARAVLWTQTSRQSPEARAAARKELNRCYDRFVLHYGSINHTVIRGDEETGDVRRTMPNLVKFREDPDAQFVMALEDYSEEQEAATKAPLLRRDVLPELQPPTQVTSAEQALLLCLNETSVVDLAWMSQRYGKPEDAILDELGDLIYHDPAQQCWVSADTYLAGNVRQKLVEASEAGDAYARNVQALTEAQPTDLPPSQIEVNTGTPWVPETDHLQFAHEVFEVPPGLRAWALTMKHLPSEALWSLHAERFVKESPAASVTYGTDRANGVRLLEDAMNGRLTTIYDHFVDEHGNEKRVLNEDETVAARAKQRELKDKFKQWVFADHERTKRLVRVYNDRFNNERGQVFDGSHLTFPGLSAHLTPYHTQRDATWRALVTGNTLLAHEVGFGKTNACLMAAMKMKQAGLIRKPIFVVLNSTLTQWTRAAIQAYPAGKFLMATKDDCTKARRKLLAAKILTHEWDGIFITHTSFEKMGMSAGFQVDFITRKIEEYERVLDELYGEDSDNHRNFIKRIEKKKARYEEKLETLMDKKDDGLTFDELGIDLIVVDEAQAYKNQDIATKITGVAGVATGGSNRAFDLGMKLLYLRQQYPQRQTLFATATPISNSITEIYTMQQYLDPEGLIDRGIDTFDAWLSVFGEQKERYEIAPDGNSIKPRVRIDLQNLTDLQRLFLKFTDVRTHKDIQLPIPQLAGGKPATVAVPMSPLQRELQMGLVERYEAIRQGGVNPKEDNALKITGEGRKLALDARLLRDTNAWPESKLTALCDRVVHLWREGHGRRTVQLIFSDLGVSPTSWGFSFYDAVVLELVARGIPLSQIARMDEADTDAKKFILFEKVKRGDKRIILGSTSRMGTGVNVQDRLVAVHHVDAPWKPAEMQQRDGRLLRQGNLHFEWGLPVYIFRYVTTGSFDSFMWQALETKARLVGYIMDGTNTLRKVEDISEHQLSYAEVKAIASGNPLMLDLAKADADVQRLQVLKRHYQDRLYDAQLSLEHRPGDIDRQRRTVAQLDADLVTMAAHEGETHYTLDDGEAVEEAGASAKLEGIVMDLSVRRFTQYWPLGTHLGLTFGVRTTTFGGLDAYVQGEARLERAIDLRKHRGQAVLWKVREILDDYPRERARAVSEVARLERQLAAAQQQQHERFAQETYLTALEALRDDLRLALTPNPPEGHRSAQDLAAAITALHRQHAGSAETPRETEATQVVSVSASLAQRIAERRAAQGFAEEVEDRMIADEEASDDSRAEEQGAFAFAGA